MRIKPIKTMSQGINITVVRGGDWEVIYVDGEKEAEHHLNRLWPSEILDIIEGEKIGQTNTTGHNKIIQQVEEGNIGEDEVELSPDGSEVWEFPETLPEELY